MAIDPSKKFLSAGNFISFHGYSTAFSQRHCVKTILVDSDDVVRVWNLEEPVHCSPVKTFQPTNLFSRMAGSTVALNWIDETMLVNSRSSEIEAIFLS